MLRNKKGQFRKSLFIPFGLVLAMVVGLGWGFVKEAFAEKIVYQKVEVEVEVDSPAVIMEKISDCESGDRDAKTGKVIKGSASQFDKNGQVLINPTQDMGKYQIHVPIWGKKATELGFNLATEEGNTKMAYWLYKNKGTEPWIHSKKCWLGLQ